MEAAREEFLLSGYARASMRAIAAQAGMTVGNIYLYFSGKEQLFDALVGETVEQLRVLMRMTSASDESIRELAEGLHRMFIQSRVEFLLLTTRSEGSKYEPLKETIIDFARRRMPEQFGHGELSGLYGPLSVALIEGLLFIFNRFEGDEARLTQDLIQFLNYMLCGLLRRERKEAVCAPHC